MFRATARAGIAIALSAASVLALSACATDDSTGSSPSGDGTRTEEGAVNIVIDSHGGDYAIPERNSWGQIKGDRSEIVVWNEIALAQDSAVEHVFGADTGGVTNTYWLLFISDLSDDPEQQAKIAADAFNRLGQNYADLDVEGKKVVADAQWCLTLIDASEWDTEDPFDVDITVNHQKLSEFIKGAGDQNKGNICVSPSVASSVESSLS